MNRAMLFLLLTLTLSACSTTETIVEYKEVVNVPPESILTICERPFNERPKTYGESVERDEIWRRHFDECALKIKMNREHYGIE